MMSATKWSSSLLRFCGSRGWVAARYGWVAATKSAAIRDTLRQCTRPNFGEPVAEAVARIINETQKPDPVAKNVPKKSSRTSYSGSYRTESARLSDVGRYVRQYVCISISCEPLSKGPPKRSEDGAQKHRSRAFSQAIR